jgi:hypothetical protein
MPLSEHEQRLLEQIERALYADDPKFASTVKSSNPRTWLRRRVVRSLLIFVLGLVVLVVAVALNRTVLTVVFGIVGFGLMLFAALRGAADLRRLGGRPEAGSAAARGSGAAKQKPKVPFMERVEERWRRRWEERGDR